ncbi:MAG: hypothetical protein ACKOOH_09860 [Cyanobium sp.]
MKTLDTNGVVRVLIGDDPQQTAIAQRAFLEAIAAGGVYLPDVVLGHSAQALERLVISAEWIKAASASAAGTLLFNSPLMMVVVASQ